MKDFFARRWRGQVALSTLFWRDLVAVATAISLASTVAAVVALEFGASGPVALAIFLLPMPYNIFLWSCVWRVSAGHDRSTAFAARLGATLWLFLALIL